MLVHIVSFYAILLCAGKLLTIIPNDPDDIGERRTLEVGLLIILIVVAAFVGGVQ